ncbi:MAG: hypothetical protein Tsb0013_11220 [Phycisphaerales bacterium]
MRLFLPLCLMLPLVACKESPQTGTYTSDASPTAAATQEADPMPTPRADAAPILEGLTMNRLDGTPETLSEAYGGKTLLIVNTASRCGLTPQYKALEALYQSRKGDGLVVLGFPANDFMGQEPLSNSEIAEFCEANYGVSFPMFEKTSVKGEGVNELFARLTEATDEPSWNFTKYLVTPDGVITRFDPRTTPDSEELTGAIDAALGTG